MTKNLKETYYGKKIDNANILNVDSAIKKLNGSPVVIVTGVTGQDGSLMVDYLLKNTEYQIFGGVRRLSVFNHKNINHIQNERFSLVNFDLTDSHTISRVIEKLKPAYFINFAAQSFVGSSWDFPRQTFETNCLSVLDILESIRLYANSCRVYQAGSSEEFGNVSYTPQDENHPLKPRSPYGASKSSARQLIKVYRDSYNMYAVQGWLFNHEGIRRGEEFVSRKISKHIAIIQDALKQNKNFNTLKLGNIHAKRDWSDAEDFIDGIWRMLNQEKYNKNFTNVKDYVLSSGELHTVSEFVEEGFKIAGIRGKWINDTPNIPENEKFIEENTNKILVEIDPKFYRPAEVDLLLGDSTLAQKELGWKKHIEFKDLVKKMIENDIEEIEK